MQKHTGGISRAALSYDMAFFAMVRLALSRETFGIRKRRCAFHPLRKRPTMRDNEALTYAAYVGSYLAWNKLRDTVADEHGMKKAGAVMVMPLARGLRKAGKHVETPAQIIDDALAALASLEASHCAMPDAPADLFGEMLGALLSYGFDGNEARIASEIGLHVGRWIYLADAICDEPEDRKKNAYNPFTEAYPDAEDARRFLREEADVYLSYESTAALRAVELIDFSDRPMLRACLENVLTDGIQSALERVRGKENAHESGPV